MEIKNKCYDNVKHHASVIPRYLNLEPSLAMDWLEISWDELHIKERVGAGTLLILLSCNFLYLNMLSS